MKKSLIITGLLFATLAFSKEASAIDISVNKSNNIGIQTISFTANDQANLYSKNTTDAFYDDFTEFNDNSY